MGKFVNKLRVEILDCYARKKVTDKIETTILET